MSEPKWTPGPWEIARYENHEGFSVWAKGSGCITERWWPTKERDIPIGANAHLIAAAPDLYEALDSIVRLWTLPVSNELVSRMIVARAMEPAMNALKKARGEA